ncbi:conserved exported hypothetical protein [Desulfarculales bacterium]
MRAKVLMALLLSLLSLSIFLAGCAYTGGGNSTGYDDQRRPEEMEWDLAPWR